MAIDESSRIKFQSTPGINAGRIPFAAKYARAKSFLALWREPLHACGGGGASKTKFTKISIKIMDLALARTLKGVVSHLGFALRP